MKFEWDARKSVANLGKHGIRFDLAITTFDDPYALVAPDSRHSTKEKREWLIGESDRGVLVVVFTRQGESCRTISVRRASRRERRMYEQAKRIPI